MAPMESDCGWALLVEPSTAVTAEPVCDVGDWLTLALPVVNAVLDVLVLGDDVVEAAAGTQPPSANA